MSWIVEYQFRLRIRTCHIHQPVELLVHHTGCGIRHYLDLSVGHPKSTHAILTEQHSVIDRIRYVYFRISPCHAIILVTDNQCIPMAIDSSHRHILHQFTLKAEWEVFHIHFTCSYISTQVHRSGSTQVLSDFHLISFIQRSRTSRFRDSQHNCNWISIKTFIHQKTIVEYSYISRGNAIDNNFRRISRIYILRQSKVHFHLACSLRTEIL